MNRLPRPILLLALAATVLVLAGLSLMAGKAAVPWSAWTDAADPRWAIIFELRLPRTVLSRFAPALLRVLRVLRG